ncbi:MAG: phospho-sugar mutase [Clostridia bacterium]|nr:phospho-sugar mutase [Clostridia bacterium]
MDYGAVFSRWLDSPGLDDLARKELMGLSSDLREIEDRFGRDLAFGTGGMRGKLGVGTNRMNRYVVRRATEGFASFLLQGDERARESGVVIAYDSRRGSREFAEAAALTLASRGIPVHLFDEIAPTPVLSFAVRELGAAGGIVITASHNPPEYNGYKAYGPNGGQLLPEPAAEVAARAEEALDYLDAPGEPKAQISQVGSALFDNYVGRVVDLIEEIAGGIVPTEARAGMGIVYTPLHGTGYRLAPRVLESLGFSNVYMVTEQSVPNGDFPTVKLPNPEDPAAFAMAISLANEARTTRTRGMNTEGASGVAPEILLGTDPDCDRVGVAVRDGDGWRVLTGNQVGVILCDFLIDSAEQRGVDLRECAVVKTIVTTEMVRALASAHGVETIDTLTGFKYIGALMGELEQTGTSFLLGLEESCGYLAGTFVRDKDAIIASALVACAAARQHARGRTLLQRLEELYGQYGYYVERLHTVAVAGASPAGGPGGADDAMDSLRRDVPDSVGDFLVTEVHDYLTGWTKKRGAGVMVPISLPRENCIQLVLTGGGKITLRPSGTEPKLKLYVAAMGRSAQEAEERAGVLEASTRRLLPVAP